jgi:hypothetical protein
MHMKKIMLFWKEHKDDTECMHCGRFRYVNVINEDGTSITTKVVVKQLHYIPITQRLKRLFLCQEMVQQMRWHKEGIRDSEDVNIMSHPVDAETWHALDRFDPEFARDLCDRTTSEMRGLSPKIISGDSRQSENAQIHTNKHTIPDMKFKLKLLQIKCHVLGFTKDKDQNMLQKIIRVFAEAFVSHDRHTLFTL